MRSGEYSQNKLKGLRLRKGHCINLDLDAAKWFIQRHFLNLILVI